MTSPAGLAPGTGALRILIVDDHPLFRQGLARIFDHPGYLVVGEAGDGLEAVVKARELKPQVVLMDINMPISSGLEATLRLLKEVPQARVLILTISDNEEDLFNAIKFGARGYLLKDAPPLEIREAVNKVAAGEAVFSSVMAAKLLEEFRRRDLPSPSESKEAEELSPREMEVIRLLRDGAPNREIAEALYISENTVRTHLKNILEKLHLRNRSQAAAYAARLGVGL